MKTISYCIPCYKSEKTINSVIDEIIEENSKFGEYDYEIILVDDSSPDDVFSVICARAKENKRIRAIQFVRNFGQQAGLIAASRYAQGDIVVFLDDDGQCPVNHLNELIEPLNNGFDISMAKYRTKKQGWFKNFGSKLNDITEEIMTNKPRGLYASNFVAVKQFIVKEISKYSGPYPYFTGLLLRVSNKATNVEMEDRKRLSGKTTYTLRKLVSTWLNGFTNFSIKPLRIATFMGGTIAVLGIFYAVVIVVQRLMFDDITDGWSSIMCILFVLGGLILVVLGIIGEYIGRIYMSINETPQYVIRQEINIPENEATL